MFKKLAFIGILLILPLALSAQTSQVKIVALVISSAEYSPSSDNILRVLDDLGAQTLQVESPNASELRSVLKRFAAAALDNDVALVFVDGPILQTGDREFLAPSDMNLRRGSDLLTQAIPISALARATALAGAGGAIFVHSSDLGNSLPEDVTLAQTAPEPRTGVSPILLGQAGTGMALAAIFEAEAQKSDMELGDLIRNLIARVEFTVSYVPSRSILLKSADETVPATAVSPESVLPEVTQEAAGEAPVAPLVNSDSNGSNTGINLPQIAPSVAPEFIEAPIVEIVDVEEEKPLSIDMLTALQSGLSRSEKRIIQSKLRDGGFYAGLIDGIFGNQTKFAIEAFQGSINADITGVLSVHQLAEFLN